MHTIKSLFWQPNKTFFAHFMEFCAIMFVTITLTHALASCSSAEKNIRRAEAALAIGEYEQAANQYKKAYARIPSSEKAQRGKIAFEMGECYRKYGFSARALGAYQSAERYGYTDTTTLLRKGQMQLLQGDYKQAENTFRIYQEQLEAADTFSSPEPKLLALKLQAARGIESAQSAPSVKKKGSPYTVKIAQQFNSNRSDFCPSLLGTLDDKGVQLYFSSNRNSAIGNELSGITGQKNNDIFVVRKDEKGKWKSVETIEGGLNSDYDEGAPSFSPDGKTMYFTVCTTNPEYPRMAEIHTSSRSDASWGKPSPLKITNDTLSSYAHPAVSPDGQWLYFTSDMPGGYGGTDIWRASFSGGKIGSIENLGPEINTDGNECFPAFRPSGELYYSSDGLIGMGGLDLYVATLDSVSRHWTVEPLPAPMNSHADDFGITFDGLHNRGFFSSNRSTGGRGWDKIYEFSHPEVLLTTKGWVYDQDGTELPEAQVYMVGSDGTNQKLVLKSDGTFEQPLTPGVDYLFLATCKGYLNIVNELHADSLDYEYTYEQDFPLPSLSVPVLVRNVFYAFDSAQITEESTAALDRLANLLQENPNITIELASHCDYRGDANYNIGLSQRRAESVVSYLNDHGVEMERLTAKGYGADMPKIVNKKIAEAYPFLAVGDTLTQQFITQKDSVSQELRFNIDQQEICNALNRRTEFRVMRTTYGLFDVNGSINAAAMISNDIKRFNEFNEDETIIYRGVPATDNYEDSIMIEDDNSSQKEEDAEVIEDTTSSTATDDDFEYEE